MPFFSILLERQLIQTQAVYWELRIGDATCVAEDSVSRIDEPALCEPFSVRYKCPAGAFALHLSGWKENHHMAAQWQATAGYNARASISVRNLGQ